MDTRRYANLGAKPVKYLKVSCTYNVKSTTSSTKICNSTSNLISMKVDGVPTNIKNNSYYTFDSLGEHFVEFNLKGTAVPNNAFDGCTDMQYVEFEDGITTIGNKAFTGCYGLQGSVVIPDSVTSIGNEAFNSCYGITGLTLGNNLVTIGDYAFNGCNKISGELVIPDSVTSIGQYAFRYLYRISSLYLGKNLKNIGAYAFYNCKYMTAIDIPNTVDVIGTGAFYKCIYASGHLHIPDSVTRIGDYAFQGCSALTSISIGQNLTSIGNTAFAQCTNLSGNLTLPDSLLTIGASAFTSCSNLTSVNMPKNINTISKYLFAGCSKLISVENASNITSIETFAFSGCTKLKQFIIPDSVTSIEDYAFRECEGLTSIVIPDSVTSISHGTFYGCRRLTSIVIPDSVTSIGVAAFNECSGLTSINIPDSVTSIERLAFYYCDGLTSIVIPDSVTSIGEEAFYICSGLTSVVIGSGCTSIGNDAFSYCHSLTSVEIGSGITSIGNEAFYQCENLSFIKCESLSAPSISSATFSGVRNYGTLVYPEGSDYSNWLKTDKGYLGYYQWNATMPTIRVIYDVTNVEEATMLCYNTSGLFPTVTIDGIETPLSTGYTFDTPGEHIVEYSATTSYISYKAFSGCTSISYVSISEGIKSISEYAFQSCSKLKEIILPSTLTSIGSYSFSSCPFRKITCYAPIAPTLNTNSYNSSFSGLEQYCTLIYPEGSDYSSWLSFLKDYKVNEPAPFLKAVYNVTTNTEPTKLTSSLPSMVTMLVDGKEVQCASKYLFDTLGEHVVEWAINSLSTMPFKDCVNLISVDIPDGITSIPTYGFSGCTELTTINLPNSLTSVTDFAFYYCPSLTSIVIPDSVTRIERYAFYNCSGLTGELIIPDSVTSIGSYAFDNCSGLTGELIIPDGVTSIGTGAFRSCENLTSVEIGSGVTSIGNYTFNECKKLSSITIGKSCKTIPQELFGSYNQNNLSRIIVSDENTSLDSRNNCNCIINTSTNTIVVGTKNSFIPDSVTGIDQYAFYNCSGLTGELIIPDSVTRIGDYAFQYCSGLTGVEIGSGITSIGQYAFCGCNYLQTLEIGSGCTSIGNYAVSGCTALEKITCHALNAPSITSNTFYGVSPYGVLTYPENCNYSSWLNTNSYYLGYYEWNAPVSENALTIIGYKTIELQGNSEQAIRIFNKDSAFKTMRVDGRRVPLSGGYTFTTPGEHIIELELVGTDIPDSTFTYTDLDSIIIPEGVTSIGSQAFSSSNVKHVSIPDTVTSLGAALFQDSTVRTIDLVEGITRIPQYFCHSCKHLTNIVIPDSVTSISNYAFYQCENLSSITLGSGLTATTGAYTFSSCTRLSTIIARSMKSPTIDSSTFNSTPIINLYINKGADYSGWLGSGYSNTKFSVHYLGDETVEPELSLDGYDIAVILYPYSTGNTKLMNCSTSYITEISVNGLKLDSVPSTYNFGNILGPQIVRYKLRDKQVPRSMFKYQTPAILCSSVLIADGVTNIGEYAFYQNYNLKNITLPNSITSIETFAFSGCVGLTDVVIPDSVTSIGSYAFEQCENLTSITIGSGCTSIGYGAFDSDYKFNYIHVNEGNPIYDSRENCNCIIETATNTIILGSNNSFIPDTITAIGNDAFKNRSGLTGELIIPDSVTSIGQYAFRGCEGLTSVEIGSGITSIGTSAFYALPSLSTVKISGGVISSDCFRDCTALEYVELGDSVTSLDSYAFSGCSKLDMIKCDSIIAPTIHSTTFNGVPYYGTLVYPEGSDYSSWLTSGPLKNKLWNCERSRITITFYVYNGSSAKIYNGSYINLLIDGEPYSSTTYSGTSGTHIAEIDIPYDYIPGNAFSDCSSVRSIDIGFKPKYISYDAFNRCTGLKSINIPDSVTSIGIYAFYNCSSLTSINIPDGVTSIGSYVFNSCSSLTSIVIPDSVTSIGKHAFNYCTGLTDVVIGSGCTSIGEYAFQSCSGLTDVVIPDSVTSIGSYAFRKCSGLKSITIGSGCTNLGDCVFDQATKLHSIDCKSYSAPSITSNTFSGITAYGILTYPNTSNYDEWLSEDLHYLGYYHWNKPIPRIIATYNITTTKTPTQICSDITELSMFINGKEYPTTTGFTFDTLGENTVEFETNGTSMVHFYQCSSVIKVIVPDEPHITRSPSLEYSSVQTLVLGSYVTSVGTLYSSKINEIICHSMTPPSLGSKRYTSNISYYGTLTYPEGSDYSSWFDSNNSYFSQYKWNEQPDGLLRVTYDVKDNDVETNLMIGSVGTSYMFVDGERVGFSQRFKFKTKGIHVVDFVLSDPNIIPKGLFYYYYSGTVPYGKTCPDIIKIELPSTITKINECAFSYCSNLRTIICHAPTAPSLASSNIFSSLPYYGTLVYPEGSDYSSWLKTDNSYLGYYRWNEPPIMIKTTHNITSTGKTKICNPANNIAHVAINGNIYANITTHTFTQTGQHEIIYALTNTTIQTGMLSGITSVVSVVISDEVTSIGPGVFSGCTKLNQFNIPNSVTSINLDTFNNCLGLTGELIIPDSVTSIGNYAFNNCSGLTGELIIPDSVTSIGNCAFYNCSGLTGELIIPDSVTSIGSSAFVGCTSLTSVEIGSGVTSIGDYTFHKCEGLTSIVIPDSVTRIADQAFYKCLNLTGITIPDSVTSIGGSAFTECYKLKEVTLGRNLATIGPYAFSDATSLDKIYCAGNSAPTIQNNTFANILYYGSLYYLPHNSYDKWLSMDKHYLGYYKWNAYSIYEPKVYYDLTISAEDVNGRAENTIITWSYMTDGVNPLTNEPITGIQYTGTTVSESFGQNTSETETVERTITFEIMGMTATTTIIQGVWVNRNYTVNLNSQWQMSTSIANPDSGTYDGVYESFSNKGTHYSAAIMYIDIVGYENFKFYVRSYAESSYDYVVVSNLDCTLSSGTTSGSNVKMTTSGKQTSGTAISNYQLVEFTGIDGGEHRISVMYRKDSSASSGTDQGYVLIPKDQ